MGIVDHKTGMQPFDGAQNVCGSNDLLIKIPLRQTVTTIDGRSYLSFLEF